MSNVRNTTISFVMSVCPSGTTQLPLNIFLFIFYILDFY